VFAGKFAENLRAVGLDVWLDQAEITPGEDFIASINHRLAGAQWLVLVLTPDALESKFVHREVNAALRLQDQGKLAGVVPVLAKPCDPETIPPLWGTLHLQGARTGAAVVRPRAASAGWGWQETLDEGPLRVSEMNPGRAPRLFHLASVSEPP
jgi:hypothetical protein